MCRHRGNRIVRADDGNAKNFMCSYHGWTYSNEGKLVSVPGLQEAYYGELDVDNLGLVSVAHLDIYAGHVYATWAEDAPSLEAYLGNARYYMDTQYNRSDSGIQFLGPIKWILPSNWKVGVDNASIDHYHGLTTHMSSYIVQQRFMGGQMDHMRNPERRFNNPRRNVATGNGHGLGATIADQYQVLKATGRRNGEGDRALDHRLAKREEAIRRLGEFRATRLSSGGSVFPNHFLGANIAHPRGPLACEVWAFIQFDKDTPQDMIDDMRRQCSQNGANHPAGTHAQDDMDNWRNVTEAGKSPIARRFMQDLSMGIKHDVPHPDYPGLLTSPAGVAETGQRGYYRRWQEFMNAESWAEIPIDPITATFNGTAAFKG